MAFPGSRLNDPSNYWVPSAVWNGWFSEPVWALGTIQLTAHRLVFTCLVEMHPLHTHLCFWQGLQGIPSRFLGLFSYKTTSFPELSPQISWTHISVSSNQQVLWILRGNTLPSPPSAICLQAESQDPRKACLICFLSLRGHRADLSVVWCLKNVVSSIMSSVPVIEQEGKSAPCFPIKDWKQKSFIEHICNLSQIWLFYP